MVAILVWDWSKFRPFDQVVAFAHPKALSVTSLDDEVSPLLRSRQHKADHPDFTSEHVVPIGNIYLGTTLSCFSTRVVICANEVSACQSMKSRGISGKPLYLFMRYVGSAFEFYNTIQEMGRWDRKVCALNDCRIIIPSMRSAF